MDDEISRKNFRVLCEKSGDINCRTDKGEARLVEWLRWAADRIEKHDSPLLVSACAVPTDGCPTLVKNGEYYNSYYTIGVELALPWGG